jgi:hypothetical protein
MCQVRDQGLEQGNECSDGQQGDNLNGGMVAESSLDPTDNHPPDKGASYALVPVATSPRQGTQLLSTKTVLMRVDEEVSAEIVLRDLLKVAWRFYRICEQEVDHLPQWSKLRRPAKSMLQAVKEGMAALGFENEDQICPSLDDLPALRPAAKLLWQADYTWRNNFLPGLRLVVRSWQSMRIELPEAHQFYYGMGELLLAVDDLLLFYEMAMGRRSPFA